MKKQQGAALIVVLVLLAVSLMLGLSGLQASLVGERQAGNYRASTLAHMAAEANADIGIKALENRSFEKSAFTEINELTLPDWSGNKTGSLWVACDTHEAGCDSGYGAYAFVRLTNSAAAADGYYVVGMGAVRDGSGKVVAQSLPVFVKIRKKFVFKYALTALGGIHDINGKGWLPSSIRAVYSKEELLESILSAPSSEAVYYEGEPHDCENEEDPQLCYLATNKFYGKVIRAESGDHTAAKRLEEMYRKVNEPIYNVVREPQDIDLSRRNEEQCKNTSQLAFVETVGRVKGGDMFCGVLVIWGGSLDQGLQGAGSPSFKGMVVIANYASKDGEPNFESKGKVSINIKGGGADSIMEFDRDLVKAAFKNAGVSESERYVDLLTREAANAELSGVVASWR